MFFFFFFSFVYSLSSIWERERVYKIGYKEKQSQILLIFFRWIPVENISSFTGWQTLSNFFSSGLKAWLLRVRDIFRLLLPGVLGFGSPRYEPCPTTNFLIIYFRWREGVPTPVLGSQPIIWLLSSSRWSGDFFRATRCHPSPILFPSGHQVKTSVGLHCDPHSFLTVILWRLATVNSNTRIVVILFLSSQWDTTWQHFELWCNN